MSFVIGVSCMGFRLWYGRFRSRRLLGVCGVIVFLGLVLIGFPFGLATFGPRSSFRNFFERHFADGAFSRIALDDFGVHRANDHPLEAGGFG